MELQRGILAFVAGVKSTALLFDKATRPWLTGFSLAATSLWATSGQPILRTLDLFSPTNVP